MKKGNLREKSEEEKKGGLLFYKPQYTPTTQPTSPKRGAQIVAVVREQEQESKEELIAEPIRSNIIEMCVRVWVYVFFGFKHPDEAMKTTHI
jgi:hypothetical protein